MAAKNTEEQSIETRPGPQALRGTTGAETPCELDAALWNILESIARVIPYDTASIFIRTGDKAAIRAASGFVAPALVLGYTFDLGEFKFLRAMFEEGKPIVLANANDDPLWKEGPRAPESEAIKGWIGVPLRDGARIIGVLTLDSYAAGTFDQRDLDVALAFAEQASFAIQNSRLLDETRRRMLESSAIGEIGQAASAGLDPHDLCEVVGRTLSGIFSVNIVAISLYDPETGLVSTPYFNEEGAFLRIPDFPLGPGPTSEVIRTGSPLLIAENAEETFLALGAIRRTKRLPVSWMGVPLPAPGGPIGVVSLQDHRPSRRFGAEDLSLLTTLAATISTSIQNAILYQKTRNLAAETATLLDIGRELSSTLDPDDLLALIVEKACAMLCTNTAAIYLLTEDEPGILHPAAAAGRHSSAILGHRIDVGEGIIGATARTGRSEIVNDAYRDPRALYIPGTGNDEEGEKLMTAALPGHDGVAGVMAIWRGAAEPVFTASENAFLEGLARQASIAIRNAASFRVVRNARTEAEEANAVKSHFLANMSHELRTPLNSIINFAYLLLQGDEGPLTTTQRDFIARIEDSGTHLLGLINDVLDLAKIEAGRMELAFEPVDLRPVVESVVSDGIALLVDKPVIMGTDLPDDLPPVRADRTRIRQVLLNLVSNAVKFTHAGSIVVRVRADEGLVTVSVEDTGIGIDRNDLDRVFAEFVQVDAGHDRRAGGTGLGLPISRRFVEMHGGTLTAASQPGSGSVFTFTIPRA